MKPENLTIVTEENINDFNIPDLLKKVLLSALKNENLATEGAYAFDENNEFWVKKPDALGGGWIKSNTSIFYNLNEYEVNELESKLDKVKKLL